MQAKTLMALSECELDVLLDLVESKLAELLFYGCMDRGELTALKACRNDLRAARAPRREAGGVRAKGAMARAA